MPPIHETDIAEKRWSQGDWEHYELWEKVELRLRRRKWMWIAATGLLFLVLSAVPIILDRWPKWVSVTASRRLAQELNRIKREASIDHAAYRLRLSGEGGLGFTVERLASCAGQATSNPATLRKGALLAPALAGDYAFLGHESGEKFGIPGLVDSFCYDFLSGSDAVLRGEVLIGFGVLPVKDLTEGRTDRVSILLLSGPSAEISFD